MQRVFRIVRVWSLLLSAVLVLSLLPGLNGAAVSRAGTPVQNPQVPLPVSRSHAFINYRQDGAVGCRDATAEEAAALKSRIIEPVHEILPERQTGDRILEAQSAGLQIVLRGTSQLESYPAAKAAFLNAAARWQAVISTPITVVIDVDFGPKWFGQKYDKDVLGQTDTQDLGDNAVYSQVRDSLMGLGISDDRAGLYSRLPNSSVPTDIGNTNYIIAPSALWRVLGFISTVADPSTEQSTIGSPPAVGFNSAFDYDFDPSDGIDANKIDFDAVAAHEIGHVLGFDSNTGTKELDSSAPVAVSVWDLFRFRPGMTLDTFTTAQRILSSGGSQDYFAGAGELALSTGRPDGTGGDREQASHWKDDRFTGIHIGIMDPTLADGERAVITDNDLAALRSFGYTIGTNQPSSDAPTITSISFNGAKKMKISGTGFSGQVQLEINGSIVSPTSMTVSASGKKMLIKASQSVLNLQSGANQVQVISNGVSSNVFTFTL